MKMKTTPLYRVKDYFLASILYETGQKLDHREWGDHKTLWWVFEDKDKCDVIINKHYNGELNLNSMSFVESLRTVKGMLYSEA